VSCPLCEAEGGALIARTAKWRLVRAEEAGFAAFYRLIWNDHVREFSHLPADERAECMEAVVAVETMILRHLQPAKVNLASLGNVVPHLHWHVIARFDWDTHFPAPVWAAAQRPLDDARMAVLVEQRKALETDLGKLARPA